jgi:hypothetical protein
MSEVEAEVEISEDVISERQAKCALNKPNACIPDHGLSDSMQRVLEKLVAAGFATYVEAEGITSYYKRRA